MMKKSFERLTGSLVVAMAVGIVSFAADASANGATKIQVNDSPKAGHPVVHAVQPAPYRVLHLRADQANGGAPYAEGTRTSPWTDLVNGNNGEVWNFNANTASGWAGDGSLASPYRLVFNGREERVAIAAGSIPELQQVGPVTAEVWFKTGFDGASDRFDYILEYVQQPTPDFDPFWEGRGMSIVVQDGHLRVYANPWIDAGAVQPNTWYHVVVAKDEGDLRIYVNGEEAYHGNSPHMGIQQSELVLGASTFRAFEPVGFYGDFGDIAIAEVAIWSGALDNAAVQNRYEADQALYQTVHGNPTTKVMDLRAARANGNQSYTPPTSGTEWVDTISPVTEAVLHNFDHNAGSGWLGDGTFRSPHRLQFDGIDDAAAIPAGTVGQLDNVTAISTAMWLKTPAVMPSTATDYEYLIDWLEGFNVGNGMAMALHEGQLKIWGRNTTSYPFDRSWQSVARLEGDRWYHVAATKRPGQVTVYVDGRALFTAVGTELGDAGTEIVIGASTWRGEGQYADFFSGSIGEVRAWRGALSAEQVMDDFKAGYIDYNPVVAPRHRASIETSSVAQGLALAGLQNNPAVGNLRVSFTLPNADAATLELLDVGGRRVASRSVGSFGAGQHVVDLREGMGMPTAGVYFVRLIQGGQSLVRKAIVLRR